MAVKGRLILVPNLDDRDWQAIRDAMVAEIPARCPEWTDLNPSDPGVTLIEVFAVALEELRDHLDGMLREYRAIRQKEKVLRARVEARTSPLRNAMREIIDRMGERLARLEKRRNDITDEFLATWAREFPELPRVKLPFAYVLKRRNIKVEVLDKREVSHTRATATPPSLPRGPAHLCFRHSHSTLPESTGGIREKPRQECPGLP